MKLKELLDTAYDETWLKVVDNETNGDSEELFVWAADWVGGDKATLERMQPLLDREVEDVTSCLGDTPENDDHSTSIIVVNLEARESATMTFRVTCERRFVQHVVVEAASQDEAERLAVMQAAGVDLMDAEEDGMWRAVKGSTEIVPKEEA